MLAATSGNNTVEHNGVFWYNAPDTAFGFAGVATVKLGNADTLSSDEDSRLSWHNAGKSGGYRAGAKTSLNSSQDYRKLIYCFTPRAPRDPNAPPEGSEEPELPPPTEGEVAAAAAAAGVVVDALSHAQALAEAAAAASTSEERLRLLRHLSRPESAMQRSLACAHALLFETPGAALLAAPPEGGGGEGSALLALLWRVCDASKALLHAAEASARAEAEQECAWQDACSSSAAQQQAAGDTGAEGGGTPLLQRNPAALLVLMPPPPPLPPQQQPGAAAPKPVRCPLSRWLKAQAMALIVCCGSLAASATAKQQAQQAQQAQQPAPEAQRALGALLFGPTLASAGQARQHDPQ